MRYLFVFLVLISSLFSMEFYAKLEPINNYSVKSAVSGKVIYTNDEIEGKFANNSIVVKIDSEVNEVELKQSLNKLESINQMIDIQQKNYERLLKISSKSGFEKDTQKLNVINLESSKADMLIKIATLKDTIKNKKLMEKNNYIYNIAVEKDDYVNPGTLLYEAKDLSKGKLEIYVPIADVDTIKTKTIYIDDEKTDLKINKIYDVADSKHISSYKCEIIINNPKTFSRLVKIEFK